MIKERREELEKVKNVIKENFEDAKFGIFDTRNIAGDPMETIFEGKYFTIDICYRYCYYEIFGTYREEFKKLEKYYENLKEKYYEKLEESEYNE